MPRKIVELIWENELREKVFGTCDGKDVVRGRWGRRKGLRKWVGSLGFEMRWNGMEWNEFF